MALPDEEKKFSGTSESTLGDRKNLLYDWLVGRAAADPSLAHALAASEAQRSEQIKRLEESLLRQIRELQKRDSTNHDNGSADLAALKADLGQRAIVTAQSILASVEEIFGSKINELQSGLVRTQQEGQERDARLREIAGKQRAIGASIDGLGQELGARIDHLQNQLRRSMATLESRDAEIAGLKTQVENIVQSATLKSATPAPSANRLQAPIGVMVGLSDVKGQTETVVPTLKSMAGEPNILLQSYEAEADGSKDQKKQLRQRIAADIERVRAELRKRAGVSR